MRMRLSIQFWFKGTGYWGNDLRVLIYSDNIISVRGTSDCNSRQLFEKRCEVVSRAGNCVADFYMENVLVVWLTGWAEWREYDEDNKKRLL